MLALYRTAATLAAPLIGLFLRRRMARGKEDSARFGERLGRPGMRRPLGSLVWFHGASVGEALSLLPLMERIHASRKVTILLTTGTVTSAKLMAERLPSGVIHQFIPVDRPAYVRSFLDHWRPDLAIWSESDFWPNLLVAIEARSIPAILVQGRISPRSFARWRRMPSLIRALLSCFDLCLGQTPGDAERLHALGAKRVECVGNLKMSMPPLPCPPDDLAELRQKAAGRPIWLASSTHAGEEVLAARVHQTLAPRFPNLLTVIAPRHPDRGGEIRDQISAMGLDAALRSAGDSLDKAIYIADTMGELGLFYRLAPIVFVGKSLTAEGGQNPYEPARLGCAVLFGPRMSNFPEMAPHMLSCGAAIQVADENALAEEVARLLSDSTLLAARRQAALAWTDAEAGVLDAVLQSLSPHLDAAEAAHARP